MITKQEEAWAGELGNAYNKRSPGNEKANALFFARALGTRRPESIIELGAGQGANLRALHRLYPEAELAAVELNREACEQLPRYVAYQVNGSILNWEPVRTWDLSFTKGVLIHIDPSSLPTAYNVLYRCSSRWILICEYYNPKPVEVEYRGLKGLLYKRDFAGDMLDIYSDLKLLGCGFAYHRDVEPQDDITFFLLEKS